MLQLQETDEKISFLKNSNRLLVKGFTERLFIRSYIEEDFDKCLILYGDKEITKFFDHGKPRTNEEIESYIKKRGPKYFNRGKPYGIFSVFLREEEIFIGQIDLVPTSKPGELEIGWIFHKEFHNKGFCSEAVLKFLIPLIYKAFKMNFKSNGFQINRIIATAHPENNASQKVIQKAGLIFYQSRSRYKGNPRNWYCLNLLE